MYTAFPGPTQDKNKHRNEKKIACENKTKNRTGFSNTRSFGMVQPGLGAAPSLFEVSFNGQSGLSVKQDCT